MKLRVYYYGLDYPFYDEFIEGKYKIAGEPKLNQEMNIFDNKIHMKNLEIDYLFEWNGLSEWDEYMRSNWKELYYIELLKNDGTIIFRGNIEPESDIDYNEARNTVSYRYLTAEYQELSEERDDGELNFEGTFLEILDIVSNMAGNSSYQYPPESYWSTWRPLERYFNNPDNLPADTVVTSQYYILDLRDLTVADMLKTLGILGICRAQFDSDGITYNSFFSELIQGAKEPTGNLHRIGQSLLGKLINIDIQGALTYKVNYRCNVPFSVYTTIYTQEQCETIISDFYENNFSFNEIHKYKGLNSNIEIGDYMEHERKMYLITKLYRNILLYEEIWQPTEIEALLLYSVD